MLPLGSVSPSGVDNLCTRWYWGNTELYAKAVEPSRQIGLNESDLSIFTGHCIRWMRLKRRWGLYLSWDYQGVTRVWALARIVEIQSQPVQVSVPTAFTPLWRDTAKSFCYGYSPLMARLSCLGHCVRGCWSSEGWCFCCFPLLPMSAQQIDAALAVTVWLSEKWLLHVQCRWSKRRSHFPVYVWLWSGHYA